MVSNDTILYLSLGPSSGECNNPILQEISKKPARDRFDAVMSLSQKELRKIESTRFMYWKNVLRKKLVLKKKLDRLLRKRKINFILFV